jgi:hypothetical protein
VCLPRVATESRRFLRPVCERTARLAPCRGKRLRLPRGNSLFCARSGVGGASGFCLHATEPDRPMGGRQSVGANLEPRFARAALHAALPSHRTIQAWLRTAPDEGKAPTLPDEARRFQYPAANRTEGAAFPVTVIHSAAKLPSDPARLTVTVGESPGVNHTRARHRRDNSQSRPARDRLHSARSSRSATRAATPIARRTARHCSRAAAQHAPSYGSMKI